jgi:muramoyltetrapeptide carboxypeptidase
MLPSPLLPGDTIGVMAPSSHVEKSDIEKSTALLEKRGYKIFIHPQTYERDNQSAGNALQKTLALQGLWQRTDIKALWAAGGGNRALHFLDSINFKAVTKKPKLLIGFSDVTVLLNAIYAHSLIPAIHGPVFKNLYKYAEMDDLLALLGGKKITCDLKNVTVINPGKARGKLIGGNLSLFQYLPGTLPGKFWKDSILFLEDCGDEISRIDRMLLHLKRLGVFRDIKGLVLGEFTDLTDTGKPYGFTLEDIVREHTDGLDIPIVMNAPFGHGKELFPLPIGVKAALDTDEKILRMIEPAAK